MDNQTRGDSINYKEYFSQNFRVGTPEQENHKKCYAYLLENKTMTALELSYFDMDVAVEFAPLTKDPSVHAWRRVNIPDHMKYR